VHEYASEGHAVATGPRYANRYVSVLTLREGEVAHWRDSLDPVAVLSVCAGPGLSLVYSPAVDGMSGVPREDGLVLDELGRQRLAEGRQHLAALLSEHDRMRRDIRKGPLPGDIEREALEAYDEWEPADHFSFSPPGGPAISGFPDPDGHVIHTAAGPCPVPPGCLVRLLHPALAAPGELGQLRQLAVRRAIIQPVRQLWRETYRLTAAERQNGLASDRYAGHVLRFQQAYGLGRRRSWAGGFLSGAWDGGDSATARKAYPAAGLRASWAITDRGSSGGDVAVDLCLTGPVSFFPLEDQAGAPVPLADLPQEVFSEAMRDLDLIVSVTTVANDPLWLERHRGNPGLDRYWEAITGDGLDQLRVHRHEMLTALDANSGDRFELTSTDLIVRGSLATYRSTWPPPTSAWTAQANGCPSAPGSPPETPASTSSPGSPPPTTTRSCAVS
jgi:uncharacterized protein DUF4132